MNNYTINAGTGNYALTLQRRRWATVPESLTLGAIVNRLGAVPDGNLIEVVGPAWTAILDALDKDPDVLRKLTPDQFEELIAASYEKAGYDEVILTPRSGDRGRDVIATKRGWHSVRILDQAKRYAPGNRVTAEEVRALLHVLNDDRGATKGVITTTSTFAPGIATDPGIAPYVPFRLELVDGAQLNTRLSELAKRKP